MGHDQSVLLPRSIIVGNVLPSGRSVLCGYVTLRFTEQVPAYAVYNFWLLKAYTQIAYGIRYHSCLSRTYTYINLDLLTWNRGFKFATNGSRSMDQEVLESLACWGRIHYEHVLQES